MKTETKFIVPAMHCEGCKNTISTLLRRHENLEDIEVNVEDKTVQFSHPTLLNPDPLKEELELVFGEVYTVGD